MKLNKNILVRMFGFRAMLIHGDPLVPNRWGFIKSRLPRTANGERLIDIGCGSGAFTIGAALRGYDSVGLSWDEGNQRAAVERARICRASNTSFPIQDVRNLDRCDNFRDLFSVALCLENIEHVIDDKKLMMDIARCLKPGGYLLLSSPNYYYQAITRVDYGPFRMIEDGGHVRRGYTAPMLRELCELAGLRVEEITYCSGFTSQKICMLMRIIRPFPIGWVVTLPLRILPALLDRLIAKLTGWPYFSICLVAYKPRF